MEGIPYPDSTAVVDSMHRARPDQLIACSIGFRERSHDELVAEQAATLATPRRTPSLSARVLFALMDVLYGAERTLLPLLREHYAGAMSEPEIDFAEILRSPLEPDPGFELRADRGTLRVHGEQLGSRHRGSQPQVHVLAQHRFEDYPLTRQEYMNTMTHFYRGEIHRSVAWRQRQFKNVTVVDVHTDGPTIR